MSQRRDKLVNEFFENMDQAKRSMQHRFKLDNPHMDLSYAQIELLMTIRSQQPISFGAVAKQLQMTTGAVSQVVESLETKDLVTREKDSSDRRVQLLQLSSKGTKQLASIGKRRRELLEAVMDDLTDSELETWLNIQRKMITRFREGPTE